MKLGPEQYTTRLLINKLLPDGLFPW